MSLSDCTEGVDTRTTTTSGKVVRAFWFSCRPAIKDPSEFCACQHSVPLKNCSQEIPQDCTWQEQSLRNSHWDILVCVTRKLYGQPALQTNGQSGIMRKHKGMSRKKKEGSISRIMREESQETEVQHLPSIWS
jgi:hypothetical protein